MTAVPKPKKVAKVRKPLKRTSWKRGRSKRSKKSGGHGFYRQGHVDMAYRAWVREQPCLIGGPWRARLYASRTGAFYEHLCLGRVQVCHVKSRGAGGPDHGNVVPMCLGAHEEQHRRGLVAFQRRYKVTLAWQAKLLEARYQRETGAT